jgi:hypothetical protein
MALSLSGHISNLWAPMYGVEGATNHEETRMTPLRFVLPLNGGDTGAVSCRDRRGRFASGS